MARILTLAAIVAVFNITKSTGTNGTETTVSPLRDMKHRNEMVDEAFLEQKDALLEMLELKLREVKDKTKKKTLEKDNNDGKLCEILPKDKSLIMKANGISNVGAVNLLMSNGATGKGHLKLDADGISNVGRAHLDLGMEGGVNIPGISNSLVAAPSNLDKIFCNNQDLKINEKPELNIPEVPQNTEQLSLRKTSVNDTNVANSTQDNNQNIDTNSTATHVKAVTADSTSTNNVVTIDDDINVTSDTKHNVTSAPSSNISENPVNSPNLLNTVAK